jgi:hypothetical protein
MRIDVVVRALHFPAPVTNAFVATWRTISVTPTMTAWTCSDIRVDVIAASI